MADVQKMIDESRQAVARTMNSAPVRLYWIICKRISEEILKQKRADCGERIVSSATTQCTTAHASAANKWRVVNKDEG
jgi:hypothetical protein